MAGSDSKKALAEARRAQVEFERTVRSARASRRKSFERAQKAGFSLREIGDAVGLHYTRVGQILRDEQT